MVSNKNLAVMIIATIIISLGGTMISLQKIDDSALKIKYDDTYVTGKAYSAGDVNLSITSSVSCEASGDIDFGPADLNPTDEFNLSSGRNHSGTWDIDCDTGASNCEGIEVNNTGTENIVVNFSSSVTGSSWSDLGANREAEWFRYNTENGTTTGAQDGCIGTLTNTEANVISSNNPVCTVLSYINDEDTVTLEFNVTVDEATPSGSKSALITIECVQA